MNKVVVVVTAVVASLGLSLASFFVGRHFGKKAVQINQADQIKEEEGSEVIVKGSDDEGSEVIVEEEEDEGSDDETK